MRPEILQEREKTHGSFKRNAKISQQLKRILRFYGNETLMRDVHLESIDMIALKLSRILSGQAEFKDHWDDIAGYAQLGAEACQQK